LLSRAIDFNGPHGSRFSGGEPCRRIGIRLLESIGPFFSTPASMNSAAYEDNCMEFSRQFSIAQTFGQNRSSVEEEENTQVGLVGIRAWYP
jgi:hypothetical protein